MFYLILLNLFGQTWFLLYVRVVEKLSLFRFVKMSVLLIVRINPTGLWAINYFPCKNNYLSTFIIVL